MNSALSDRIHSQEGFASSQENVSLAFANTPYFVGLVPLFESSYGDNADIYFLVGADVMEKIVDNSLSKYDEAGFNMNDVLKTLFRHRFIVVNRDVNYSGGKKSRLLNANKIIEENPILNQYSNRIISTDLTDDEYLMLRIPIEGVSSSLVRAKRSQREDVHELEAVGISSFVDRRGLYLRDSNKYEAIVSSIRMFADHYREVGMLPIFYIHNLMNYLSRMENNLQLRERTIEAYKNKEFIGDKI